MPSDEKLAAFIDWQISSGLLSAARAYPRVFLAVLFLKDVTIQYDLVLYVKAEMQEISSWWWYMSWIWIIRAIIILLPICIVAWILFL